MGNILSRITLKIKAISFLCGTKDNNYACLCDIMQSYKFISNDEKIEFAKYILDNKVFFRLPGFSNKVKKLSDKFNEPTSENAKKIIKHVMDCKFALEAITDSMVCYDEKAESKKKEFISGYEKYGVEVVKERTRLISEVFGNDYSGKYFEEDFEVLELMFEMHSLDENIINELKELKKSQREVKAPGKDPENILQIKKHIDDIKKRLRSKDSMKRAQDSAEKTSEIPDDEISYEELKDLINHELKINKHYDDMRNLVYQSHGISETSISQEECVSDGKLREQASAITSKLVEQEKDNKELLSQVKGLIDNNSADIKQYIREISNFIKEHASENEELKQQVKELALVVKGNEGKLDTVISKSDMILDGQADQNAKLDGISDELKEIRMQLEEGFKSINVQEIAKSVESDPENKGKSEEDIEEEINRRVSEAVEQYIETNKKSLVSIKSNKDIMTTLKMNEETLKYISNDNDLRTRVSNICCLVNALFNEEVLKNNSSFDCAPFAAYVGAFAESMIKMLFLEDFANSQFLASLMGEKKITKNKSSIGAFNVAFKSLKTKLTDKKEVDMVNELYHMLTEIQWVRNTADHGSNKIFFDKGSSTTNTSGATFNVISCKKMMAYLFEGDSTIIKYAYEIKNNNILTPYL